MVQATAAALVFIVLTGCKISCENMPVHEEIRVLPVRVEINHLEELAACQKEIEYWKDAASWFRDNACVYNGQEGL